MIFVSIGTSEPFERLLAALGGIAADEELIVQCGESSVRPHRATCVEFLAFDDFVELVRRARVVVCHAGVGTIMVAIASGKRPVVVPRLPQYGEAIDDHQLVLARRLASAGIVTLVEEPERLEQVIAAATLTPVTELASPEGLVSELRDYISVHAGKPLSAATAGSK
jgi:UDP-N-acetylglucosamine transferase subunit ALG13